IWQHHVLDWLTGQSLGILCLYFIANPADDHGALHEIHPRIASRYMLAAAALVVLGIFLLPYGMLLFWPAFALTVGAAAYLGIGSRVFHKRDGQVSGAAKWALAPFMLTERLLRLPYWRGRNAYDQIAPGLWVGRRLNRFEASRFLQTTGVRAVLDLTA